MGINGLNTFLKEKIPMALQEVHLNRFKGKKIAIDTSIYFYKFLYKNERFIEGFFQQIYRLMLNNIMPIYIFDGIPPIEKNETLKLRKEKRDEIKKHIEILEEKIKSTTDYNIKKRDIFELTKLKKKNIRVTNYHRDTLKIFLDMIGIQYYQAPEEADIICNTLFKRGVVELVLSDDMDLLVSGTDKLLRCFNVSSNKIMFYDINKITSMLELNTEQWLNLCILSGCDYCPRIPGIGIKNAYKYILKYNTIEEILEHLGEKVPEYYLEKFNKSKEIFLKEDNSLELSQIKVEKRHINDTEPIINYLKEITHLTEKQIHNRIRIINLN
jgi:flap endonuclease-1